MRTIIFLWPTAASQQKPSTVADHCESIERVERTKTEDRQVMKSEYHKTTHSLRYRMSIW